MEAFLRLQETLCVRPSNVALPFKWPPGGGYHDRLQPPVAGGQLPVPGGGQKPVDDGGKQAQSPPTPQNSTRQKRDALECDVSPFLSPKDQAVIVNKVNDFRNSLATSPPFKPCCQHEAGHLGLQIGTVCKHNGNKRR